MAFSYAAGMFNVGLGIASLLLMSFLASSDVAHAAIGKPSMLRLMARGDARAQSAPIRVEPPKPSVAQSLSRTVEHRGCAAVERRKPLDKIDSTVLRAARTLLDLPMGAGRLISMNGRELLFCLELHYHEPGYQRGPEGWHKGVTVYSTT